MKLRPSTYPRRAITISARANKLMDEYLKQARTTDLDEAIALHQEALELCSARESQSPFGSLQSEL